MCSNYINRRVGLVTAKLRGHDPSTNDRLRMTPRISACSVMMNNGLCASSKVVTIKLRNPHIV